MIRVAVVGASGYTGGELARLLAGHPEAKLVLMTGNTNAGEDILTVFPYLRRGACGLVQELDEEKIADAADVAFLALPHGHSVKVAEKLLSRGVKVIDLGADFRFRDALVYEKWYKVSHANHDLSRGAVYGLPEIWRKEISGSRLVGNPGCYPTSIALGLYPLAASGMIDLSSIVIDAKSGVSGAGRSPAVGSLYTECNEGIKPYGVGTHRHTPEIEQSLSRMSGSDVVVSFTPHLTPMTRGILSTMYATLSPEGQKTDIYALYKQFYGEEFFIRLLPAGMMPSTKYVLGSNFCDIGLYVDKRTNRIVIGSAIDNLVKGAAGQALQNMNIIFGLPEEAGLKQMPIFP